MTVTGHMKAKRPLSRGPRGSRVMLTLSLVAALLTTTAGCSLIGDIVEQRKTTTEENLSYQRTLAQKFIRNWPDTEVITFTQEGSVGGSGEWATNAVVRIRGKEYQEILGTSTVGGDDLPDPHFPFSAGPVTVNYSDGTSEEIG